ncbi:hypothetical protein PoB_005350300 [Plakobranchus ocellatus]|uniref:Uncharacterized protein n=1 Tax=Plakobranchus ocellatus TaxID=259542 RepID=A0AAV4C7M3_9GAST|nr:hypothetical protein PoB_005350300 [Plakobranchus ocellatus]
MSVFPFAGWSPFTKFMVISLKGSAKVAGRSPFKIHREMNSILGDETIEVTKLGNGDLMVEFKSNNQAKSWEQSRRSWTFLLLSALTRA